MIPVTQRTLTTPVNGIYLPGNTGDCMRAAVASIMEVALDDVPHFADYPPGYDPDDDPLGAEHGGLAGRTLRHWLRRRWGWDAAWYDGDGLDDPTGWLHDHPEAWPRHMLGGVRSPRGDFDHAVVLDEHGQIVWDPHPAQAAYGLPIIDAAVVCRPYDPAPPDPDPWAEQVLARDTEAAA